MMKKSGKNMHETGKSLSNRLKMPKNPPGKIRHIPHIPVALHPKMLKHIAMLILGHNKKTHMVQHKTILMKQAMSFA
jgi:hypothetical protein